MNKIFLLVTPGRVLVADVQGSEAQQELRNLPMMIHAENYFSCELLIQENPQRRVMVWEGRVHSDLNDKLHFEGSVRGASREEALQVVGLSDN